MSSKNKSSWDDDDDDFDEREEYYEDYRYNNRNQRKYSSRRRNYYSRSYRRRYYDDDDRSSYYKSSYRKRKNSFKIGLRLDEKDPIKRENPHIAQCDQVVECNEEFTFESRILKDDAKGKPYRRRRGEKKTVNHWGQRKLLMSEIEFMTLYSKPEHIVVYAGAAPGTHIAYLSKLFPENLFILVDPSDFTLKETDKIKIFQEFFTDEFAKNLLKKYPEKEFLFICDIRTASWRVMDEAAIEEYVQKDMDAQARWVKILNPFKSMLKFRLPYCNSDDPITEYKYLDGTVFLPVWGPQTTSESRLVVDKDPKTKIWNPLTYERQMFYFNTVTRVMYYKHDIGREEGEGLDHCYDCMSEIFILQKYIEKYIKPKDKDLDMKKKIIEMSKEISYEISLGSGRTLLYIPPPKTGGFSDFSIELEKQRAKKLTSVETKDGRKVEPQIKFKPIVGDEREETKDKLDKKESSDKKEDKALDEREEKSNKETDKEVSKGKRKLSPVNESEPEPPTKKQKLDSESNTNKN